MTSAHTLLRGIVDYAGMFPPAALPPVESIARYRRHRLGDQSWLLGGLVLSARSVADLDPGVLDLGEGGAVSIVVATDRPTDVAVATELIGRGVTGTPAFAIEFPVVAPPDIQRLKSDLPEHVRVFFEAPVDEHLDARLDAIARCDAYAKVRTGGVTPSAFPSADRLVRFFRGCADRRIGCKATAGLHHALTGRYSLSYERGSQLGDMFGFLNVCVAAALVDAGTTDTDCIAALRESSLGAFVFEEGGLAWRGHRWGIHELASLRRHRFLSFGSCSFDEPVEELRRIRLI
jgi:hypothetical protein